MGETGTAASGLNAMGGMAASGWGDGSSDNTDPRAFVNIVLFDKNYNFLDVVYAQLTANGALMTANYKVKEAGYAYLYVSNENPTLVDIYFDDVTMSYTPSNIVQYNEYYPFGLQTANSWTRDNTTGNNFLGNGGTEYNATSSLYDLDFRNYDPILGRLHGVDPVADKYSSLTPYNFAFNNPAGHNDPSGADPYTYHPDPYYEEMFQQNKVNNQLLAHANLDESAAETGTMHFLHGMDMGAYSPWALNPIARFYNTGMTQSEFVDEVGEHYGGGSGALSAAAASFGLSVSYADFWVVMKVEMGCNPNTDTRTPYLYFDQSHFENDETVQASYLNGEALSDSKDPAIQDIIKLGKIISSDYDLASIVCSASPMTMLIDYAGIETSSRGTKGGAVTKRIDGEIRVWFSPQTLNGNRQLLLTGIAHELSHVKDYNTGAYDRIYSELKTYRSRRIASKEVRFDAIMETRAYNFSINYALAPNRKYINAADKHRDYKASYANDLLGNEKYLDY